jgi:Flp pilus assembly protein TadG
MTTTKGRRSHARSRWARLRAGAASETGSTSVQMVILMPALFLLMFLGLQAALYYHARTLAIAAATQGARTAAAQHATIADGLAAASGFVADAGGDNVLPGLTVTGTRTGAIATVHVRGASLSVLPGWTPTVDAVAALPVERLTT